MALQKKRMRGEVQDCEGGGELGSKSKTSGPVVWYCMVMTRANNLVGQEASSFTEN